MVSFREDWARRVISNLDQVEETISSDIERDTAGIEKQLHSPTRLEFGVYANRLRSVGERIGSQGILQLYRGEASVGWYLMAKSIDCLLGASKVRWAIGFPNASWHDTNLTCQLFATAVALQSPSVAQNLAQLMIASFRGDSPLPDWTFSPFQPLSLYLAQFVAGVQLEEIEESTDFPDIYDEILEAKDEESMQLAIDDFSLKRVQLVSQAYGECRPFHFAPFNLFPVDILAILMVRNSGIPRFEFGAMESPLCDPPLPFSFEKHPLVERVMDRVSSKYTVPNISW